METKANLFQAFRPLFLAAKSFNEAFEQAKVKQLPEDLSEFFYTHYGHNGMLPQIDAFKQLYIEVLAPYTMHLTLHRAAFDVMVTGEKNEEFRTVTKFINNRLFDYRDEPKIIKLVKFVNGYGNNKPAFIAEYKSFQCCFEKYGYCFSRTYSNGLKIKKINTEELYVINLGEVLTKYNCTNKRK